LVDYWCAVDGAVVGGKALAIGVKNKARNAATAAVTELVRAISSNANARRSVLVLARRLAAANTCGRAHSGIVVTSRAVLAIVDITATSCVAESAAGARNGLHDTGRAVVSQRADVASMRSHVRRSGGRRVSSADVAGRAVVAIQCVSGVRAWLAAPTARLDIPADNSRPNGDEAIGTKERNLGSCRAVRAVRASGRCRREWWAVLAFWARLRHRLIMLTVEAARAAERVLRAGRAECSGWTLNFVH
jgi:hypothetical protein